MGKFKKAFKEARQRRGITQREAADAASIALGTLRRWEQGVNEPDVESLVTLADLYGVSVDELLGVPGGVDGLLAEDEQHLLDLYRSTDDRGRLAIMSVAESQQGVEGQAEDPVTHPVSA